MTDYPTNRSSIDLQTIMIAWYTRNTMSVKHILSPVHDVVLIGGIAQYDKAKRYILTPREGHSIRVRTSSHAGHHESCKINSRHSISSSNCTDSAPGEVCRGRISICKSRIQEIFNIVRESSPQFNH